MLDQYIETLVKESKVQDKLDTHIEELTKQAAAEVELQQFLEKASVGELAKLAGVELPEGVCSGCGSQMEKLGSIYQCQCGLMKEASVGSALKGLGSKALSLGDDAFKAVKGKAQQVGQTFQNARRGSMGSVAGPLPKGEGTIGKSLLETAKAHPGVAAGAGGTVAGLGAGYAMGKSAEAKDEADKSIRPGWLAAQRGMERATQRGSKGLHQYLTNPELVQDMEVKSTLHGLAGAGIGAGVGGLSGLLAGLVSKGKIRPADAALLGAAGLGLGGLGVGSAHGAISAQNEFLNARGIKPRLAGLAGASFSPEAAEKYLAKGDYEDESEKTSAARLLEVGDAAGRIMAKVANEQLSPTQANFAGQPMMTPEELEEAIQGAQGREDVQSRANRWGQAGAAAGGVGGAGLLGGVGYGVSRALGKNRLLGAGIGALGGAALGGTLGQRIGRAEGAEEAVADKLVSMLRARRAYNAGAGRGYMAGLSHGLGYQGGGQGEGEQGPQ